MGRPFSLPINDPDIVIRIIGGRNRHNAQRKRITERRRWAMLEYLVAHDGEQGIIEAAAAEFGVSRRTAFYDLQAITEGMGRCRSCGQPLPHVSQALLKDDPQLGPGSDSAE